LEVTTIIRLEAPNEKAVDERMQEMVNIVAEEEIANCGVLPDGFLEELKYNEAYQTLMAARDSVIASARALLADLIVRWSRIKKEVRLFKKSKQQDPSPACRLHDDQLLDIGRHLKFKFLVDRVLDAKVAIKNEKIREVARQQAWESHLEVLHKEEQKMLSDQQHQREKNKGKKAWSNQKRHISAASGIGSEATKALERKEKREILKGKKAWRSMGARGKAGAGSFTLKHNMGEDYDTQVLAAGYSSLDKKIPEEMEMDSEEEEQLEALEAEDDFEAAKNRWLQFEDEIIEERDQEMNHKVDGLQIAAEARGSSFGAAYQDRRPNPYLVLLT